MSKKSSQKAPNVGVVSPAHCVGPDYRPDAQKPTATVSTKVEYEKVHTLPQTPQLIALLTCVLQSLCALGGLSNRDIEV